ncbi:MAG: molybdopterin-dependent oxidoreductase [bacterium]
MKQTRRDFMKVTGGAVTAYSILSLTGCLEKSSPGPGFDGPLEEKYFPNVCLQCPGGCGILVRTVNGRAVKIEGNPLYPSNQGGTCPKGQLGLQILYDPDRIKGPMQQMGERGDPNGFRPISWGAAIDVLVTRLREIRANGEPHTLVFMGGRYRGQMHGVFGRFLESFGTPNDVGHSSICEDGSPQAHWLAQGWKSYAAYDWKNSEYVICFGGEFIEAWRPTASLLRAWGQMRRGRMGTRTKFVQVEPRFSVTASKADEWLPVNPGTDAALALGLAHVIVREELYDKKFIEEHGFGFDDWTDEHGQAHRGFKDFVLREWSPEKAGEISGIPAGKIEKIAREFAAKAPHCIAAGARGTSMQSNGVFTRFAIHALNGLVGSIDSKGGILRQNGPPLAGWPEVFKDDTARTGFAQGRVDYAGTKRFPMAKKVYQDIADRILEGKPYPVNVLLCYYTNPLFSSPDIGRWYEAIKKVPFVATFSPFMDETSAHADLILPDSTYLERWTDDVIYPSLGYPVVGLRHPVVKPVFDTRNATDVLIEVARKMGGTVGRTFPWKDAEEMLKSRYQGIFEARKGSFVADTFEAWWEKFCAQGVWTAPPYPYAHEHPDQWPRVLVHDEKDKAGKEPGKFQFYSLHLKHKLEHLAEDAAEETRRPVEAEFESMLTDLKVTARGDELYLPHYEPVRRVGDSAEFPLVFITYKTMALAEGRGANAPLALERFVVQTREKWAASAQMNPETAARYGLEENDEIWIESTLGKIRTTLKLVPHHPDVVAMPFGLGHREYGRWAKNLGVNPNSIIVNEHDHLGGLAAWFSTRVKVYKA